MRRVREVRGPSTVQDLNRRTFLLFAYIFNFFTPMILIGVFYVNIVRAVVAHEAALRAQAKKMNVDSLRSGGKDDDDSAEVKIAKVAITNVLLWVCIWTPYATISAFPALGLGEYVTPLLSQLPSFMGENDLSIPSRSLISYFQPRPPAVSTPSCTPCHTPSSARRWPGSSPALGLEPSRKMPTTRL